jgi:hypothetical protein
VFLNVSGTNPRARAEATASAPAPGTKIFSPYVDMGITSDENLVSIQQKTGIKGVTLAFIVATGSGCTAGWGGLHSNLPNDKLADGTTIQSVVKDLQKANVQVIISFGGSGGTEPAAQCKSESELQAIYQSVIDRYGVKMLDFDIEGSEASNQSANTLRDKAVVALKKANPGLYVSYTLQVLPTGLISSGVSNLQGAKKAGLALDLVNVLAMDYGSEVDNHGQMGTDAVDAAENTEKQIKTAGLSAKVGVTVMVGVNDVSSEVFTPADVNTVLNFANDSSSKYVDRLAIWSLARDNGSCAGQTYASPTCSGLKQSTYQFSDSFKTY